MEFRVLGPVELAVDGRAVPIRSPLQRTLLALLLADANRAVSVDRIVDALWGADGWESGEQRLWFHVSKLRARLSAGDGVIERTAGGYLLRVDPERVDARRFERAVERARRALDDGERDAAEMARVALGMWRGAPYADVPDDAVGRAARTRLEQLHLAAQSTLVEAELRAGHADAVVADLEKLIIEHPYREEFRHQLMRALWMLERPAEARAVFAATRVQFADELGIEPSATLRELAARIEAAVLAPVRPAEPAAPVATAAYGGDVFVGRDATLGALRAAIDAGRTGTSAAFVRGQAGAGKTSLLRALVTRAETADPALVGLYTSCQPGTGPVDAFGPFRDLARRLDGDGTGAPAHTTTAVGRQRLATLTVPAAPAAAVLDAMQRTHEAPPVGVIADLLRQMIDALAAEARLLLVLDDLHWADAASLDVILRLVRQVRGRLTCVAAYRPHELRDQRVGQLEREVRAAAATSVVVDLDRTSPAERRRFVDALLDREANTFGEHFRRLLSERSDGHALFAVELIDELRRRGAIRRRGGRWDLVGSVASDTWPERVQAVLQARFARIDDQLMAVLRAASVEGETFTTALIADVLDRDERRVITALSHSAAAAHQVVVALGPDRVGPRSTYRYRFRHHLFQRHVYEGLDDVERALLHRRFAETITALTDGADDEWAVTLARHHEAAGDAERAVVQLARAAQRAVRLAANEEAVAHVERALQLVADVPAGPRRDELTADLYLQLGLARSVVEGFAAPVVEETFALAATLPDGAPPERHFPALFGLWVVAVSRADMVRSAELSGELEAAADAAGDDGLRVMALHARWTDRLFYGDIDGCRAAVDAVRGLYRHERHHALCYRYGNHDPAVCAFALGAVAAALAGDTARATRLSDEACALADVLDHRPSRVQAVTLASWVPQLRGDAPATRAAADRALGLEAQGSVPLWFGLARFMRGWARVTDMADVAALGELEEELQTQRDIRTASWMPLYASLLADAYLAAGEPERALDVAGLGEDPARPFYSSEIARVRACAHEALGQIDEAADGLARSVDEATASGAHALALRSALDLRRVAPAAGTDALDAAVAALPKGHRSPLRSAAEAVLGGRSAAQ